MDLTQSEHEACNLFQRNTGANIRVLIYIEGSVKMFYVQEEKKKMFRELPNFTLIL